MKKKIRLYLFTVLIAACLLLTGAVVDRIAAVIGNEVITLRELDYAYNTDVFGLMRPESAGGNSAEQMSKEQYLDYMIEQKVIEQEVKRQGIMVDALDVERAIDRKRESLGLTEDQFKTALSRQGLTMEVYRDQVRRQLITYRLISQEVQGEVEVTEEEIQAFYQQNPEAFLEPDKYHLRLIYLPFPIGGDTATGAGAVKSRMADLRQSAVAGKDFAELARLFSSGNTAPQGGDIGWFTLSELDSAMRELVAPLAVGGVSQVLIISQGERRGAYLFYVQEIQKGGLQPLDQVRDAIHDLIFQQKAMERYDLWLERLKARTYIENRLQNPAPKESSQ